MRRRSKDGRRGFDEMRVKEKCEFVCLHVSKRSLVPILETGRQMLVGDTVCWSQFKKNKNKTRQ